MSSMSSNSGGGASSMLLAGLFSAAALGGFWLVRARKQNASVVRETEKLIPPRNASWFSFDRIRGTSSQDEWLNNQNLQHPEGPNIGFESNTSWVYNATSRQAAKTDLLHRGHIKGGKLVVVMVGLPGRGKTFIARKVARYLRWISYRTRNFSIAKYRLDKLGSKTADFFDTSNAGNIKQRVHAMTEALEDALRYLSRGGEIAIIDGTNTTTERRDIIRQRVSKEDGYDILWVESVCDELGTTLTDLQIEELKNSPDFIDKADYEKKLAHYRKGYTALAADEGSFVRVYDYGRTLTVNAIHGFLPTKIVAFVMNLKPSPRPIFICRHGESTFNVRGLIGGDASLSPRGVKFSRALAEYINSGALADDSQGGAEEISLWSSTMRRARETAAELKCKRLVEWRALREIEVGVCDGLSYEQVKTRFPDEYRSRHHDKLRYRYPRGESYLDVITRLEPVIYELERQEKPLIIVAHQAVLRCLYAYFLDLPADEIPFLSIPLHTLIRLEAKVYGCKEKRMRIVIDPQNGINDSMDGDERRPQ